MKSIFDYVWLHFNLIYRVPKSVRVQYGDINADGKVTVEKGETDFFSGKMAQPANVVWLPWQRIRLPFFFQDKAAGIWQQTDGKVKIEVDLIASAFFLLSGWQEYHSDARDQFGRYPFAESVQHKYNFVTRPVVNYYFDILKSAIERAYDIEISRKLWPAYSFQTCITHDIDRCESAWKVKGKKHLQERDYTAFFSLFLQKWLKNDQWFNFDKVMEEVEQAGAHSTFFFLPSTKKYQGHPNADYKINSTKYQRVLKQISEKRFEIGLHGSFGTSNNLSQLQQEKGKLPKGIKGNRFHYLCYDPKRSPQVLEKSEILYDSTLGFAEHFGFRNSYCFPFYPFNFEEQKAHRFLELPLNLMDTTLHHPNYLQLKPEVVLPAIQPMLQEIQKFGGLFTLLWHNEHFENEQLQGTLVFNQIINYCKKQGSGFRTGSQIYQAVEDTRS